MKITGKTYTIELDEKEIDCIVEAAQIAIEHWRTLEPEEREKENYTIQDYRPIRNDLAALVGRFFMGADA